MESGEQIENLLDVHQTQPNGQWFAISNHLEITNFVFVAWTLELCKKKKKQQQPTTHG